MPFPETSDARTLEKYSSAFTLSDMEVFLFPELLYALVLGNILSPEIWTWRDDPWFEGVATLPFGRQIQRLKQFIMDHYSFNLDLDTWGLTSKPRELARFGAFVDPEIFSRSNALFGYEGDKYYFDLDIRRHFGLDKYDGDVIPYWKTETVEAMNAFQHRPGYRHGAGECVSLSALYAAAVYIVLQVPLEDIFVLATPLHSQNFILRDGGVLTNNRRIVNKTMWFNGTELSTKARRALDYERVTIVSHLSGYAHIDYPEATIDSAQYRRFREGLGAFLKTPVNFEVFINFLRVHEVYRKHFQFEFRKENHVYFLPAEVLFHYEHGSKNRIGDRSRRKLLDEVESEEFGLAPDPARHMINLIEEQLNGKPLTCQDEEGYAALRTSLHLIPDWDAFRQALCRFTCGRPRLPEDRTDAHVRDPLVLPPGMERGAIRDYLLSRRSQNRTVDLAFYASREMDEAGWTPFLKACLERNPVSLLHFQGKTPAEVFAELETLPPESIYAGETRLATPDEVVNFRRGDGLEKALCLANCLKNGADPAGAVELETEAGVARVKTRGRNYEFATRKSMRIKKIL